MTKPPSDASGQAIDLHRKWQGKIQIQPRDELTPESLNLLYTPGVAAVSRAIAHDPAELANLTWAGRTVAVISDGSAVLGLGNVGPGAAMPVMEGKALLFKALADVDAVPIVLDTQDTEAIIATVKAIAPSFGAINLEDISAPRCYEIERRLQEELPIPVVHDDQQATAVVVLAGLINATRVTGRDLHDCRIIIVGSGAAGSGLVKLLSAYKVADLLVFDSRGLVSTARDDLDESKRDLVELTTSGDRQLSRAEAFTGADIVIGVSIPGAVTAEDVRSMATNPIVFALANPDPEIDPAAAKAAGAAVIATGRSDYPNQINNVLVFPGLFRGALDRGVRDITTPMKLAAASALAGLIDQPTAEEIIPTIFDKAVVPAVAAAIKEADTMAS